MSKKENEICCKFKSKIGGQALIEGVMMMGPDTMAMACRLPDGNIDVETSPIRNGKNAPWYKRIPFVRGCFNFVGNLIVGSKCLMKSAEKQLDDDEEEELSPFEQWLTDKFGDKLMPVLTTVIMIFAFALSLLLFKFLPMGASWLLGLLGLPDWAKTIFEGIFKILLLTGYMYAVSFMPDMRTLFMYHGAEHKTIACHEAEMELTVENVRKCRRFHPRCGTSFILLVALLGIFIGMFLPWSNIWVRLGIGLLLYIPEASVAYELIRLAGKFDNPVTRVISAPGLWLQHITTREPTDAQIECAIAALKPCIPKDKSEDNW